MPTGDDRPDLRPPAGTLDDAALDAALDAAVGGRTPPIPDAAVTAFARLRSLDAVAHPAPDPALAARLWEDLMAGADPVARHRSPNGRPVALPPRLPVLAPRPGAAAARVPGGLFGRLRHAWPAIQTAAAVLLVAALTAGVAGVAFRLNDRPEPGPSRVAGLATPDEGVDPAAAVGIADVPVAGGEPGRTNEQPGPGPGGTPSERWRVDGGFVAGQAPVVAGGLAYLGTEAGELVALDAATGAERWRTPLGGGAVGAPTVADGVVYAGDEARTLHAVDAVTGAVRWARAMGEGNLGDVALGSPVGDVLLGSPVVGSGFVAVAVTHFVDPTAPERNRVVLRMLDLADGRDRWSATVDGGVGGVVALRGDRVYAALSNRVLAFDAVGGVEQWRVETGGAIRSLAVGDAALYFTDMNGTVIALDLASGQDLWRVAGRGGQRVDVAVATGGDGIYVASGAGVRALEATSHSERWRYRTPRETTGGPADIVGDIAEYAGPVLAGGAVFYATFFAPSGTPAADRQRWLLAAIDAADGQELWRVELDLGGAPSTPVVVGGLVYLVADGALIALGDAPPTPPA